MNTVTYVLDTLETLPGKNSKTFTIRFAKDYFLAKDNVLYGPNGVKFKVTKTYKFNLWRRILYRFGIKFKMHDCVKVEQL